MNEKKQLFRCGCPSHTGDACFSQRCPCLEHYDGKCSGFVVATGNDEAEKNETENP